MGVAQVCQPHFNMIGLFKRPQTNRKDNEKGMQLGCQQPLLLGGALRDSPKKRLRGRLFEWPSVLVHAFQIILCAKFKIINSMRVFFRNYYIPIEQKFKREFLQNTLLAC